MKIYKLKKRYLSMLIATTTLLSACGGGNSSSSSSSSSSGQNATGASIQASSEVRSLFAANNCLSAKVNLSGTGWYLSGNVTLTNNCNTSQAINGNTISFTSQNLAKAYVAITTPLNNWWINNDQYTINFTNGGANQVIGTIIGKDTSAILLPNQSIKFDGGVNMPDGTVAYDSNTANTTLVINGSAPVAQTGTMTVSVNSKNADCSGTICNSIKVAVNDVNGKTVATVAVPATSAGAIYTQKIESLNAGSYTLSASAITNNTITYAPSAALAVVANTDTPVTVSYQQAQQVGQAAITLPNVFSGYKGNLLVKLLNTKESNSLVNTYAMTQGQTLTTEALPISDPKHQYAVQVQGIADPAAGNFYIESGLAIVNISNNKTTAISIPFKTATVTKRTVSFVVSGLNNSTAGINFQDSAQKYAYPSYSGLTNSSVKYYFENNTTLGYSVKAAAGNYKVNPLESTNLITANKTITVGFESAATPTPSGSTVAGWPEYLAMGAVGGANTDPVAQVNSGGDDSFGGKPVDAVFKYAGVNGNGDPGVIDPPMNAIRMANDLTEVAKVNDRASRVVIIEYTGEMSGGENFADFTNNNVPNPNKQNSTYIMARHFASLAADAQALADKPVVKDGKKYYGSMILNPDLLGAMEQNGYIDSVNGQLPANAVNSAVDQALCLLTNSRSYTNTATPNGDGNYVYKGKTYTGTPYQILSSMLSDGYPVWSISGTSDAFWGTGIDNKGYDGNYSQMGQWFNACVTNPSYDKTKYTRPNFPAGFDGWVQANNWLIRTFAAKSSGVTFAWQTNMWAVNSGFWLHNELSASDIAAQYSTKVSNWLKTYAPSSIMNVGSELAPDYFVFDRYEMDDSAAPGSATLYSARSWDNYLIAVGQVSKAFNNIPMMLWQIPGSHLPYTGEVTPELFGGNAGSYIFSTAPVYFFGDNNLKSDLSNLIMGSSAGTTNAAVGSYLVQSNYNCTISNCNYQQYLRFYAGKANNYDWSRDNGKLAFAASNGVFAILWGGGNTTNVIKNFSNPDDHGWLANKIKAYYQNPQKLK
ncbi:MAG: hypothetical protein K2X04_01130 [Burkholderiales bacterium]|nr:hypothetical protein [Burkholderiales bacterium]